MDATQATSDVVRKMAAAMEENRRYLTKLDSEIGDGDHGNNMNRGFKAVLERLEGADPSTPADVLKAVSMALISKVGGAAGPLYGTAFLRASSALGDKEEVSAEDAAEALEAMTRWAFGKKDIVFVEAEADPDNKASLGVLEKCGFVPDGTGAEGPRFVLECPLTNWSSVYMLFGISIGMSLGVLVGMLLNNSAKKSGEALKRQRKTGK